VAVPCAEETVCTAKRLPGREVSDRPPSRAHGEESEQHSASWLEHLSAADYVGVQMFG